MRLRFERRIGSGAHAEVWLAKDEELVRPVAVKFVTSPALSQRDSVSQQARALARVQHPAVVTIHAVEDQPHPESGETRLAIIMEYVAGLNLNEHSNPVSPTHARSIVTALTAGLAAIHEAGLVHSDLHERNVMITDQGAKILDVLYTTTLADADSSSRDHARVSDLRSLSSVLRLVLEKTDGTARNAIADAYYASMRGQTFAEVAGPFLRALPNPTPISDDAELFLVWLHEQDGVASTHLYLRSATGHAAPVGRITAVVYAFEGRVWELQSRTRAISIYTEQVLDRWWSEGFDQSALSSDDANYRTVELFDPVLACAGETLELALASPDPRPMSRLEVFEIGRSVSIRGALGEWLFLEEQDYAYAGGAHGSTGASFRLLDIKRALVLEGVEAIFTKEELDEIGARHAVVAHQIFKLLRAEESLGGDDEAPSLVTARPAFSPDTQAFELLLAFATFTFYLNSGRRWSSYSMTEEVSMRSLPARLREYAAMPAELEVALGPTSSLCVGWSRLSCKELAAAALMARAER